MANAELRLAAELAVAVSQFMQSELRDESDSHGFIWHMFQSPFDENGCVLWELGTALAAPTAGDQGIAFGEWNQAGPDDVGPGAYSFMPPDTTRSIVMSSGNLPPATLLRLLATYLRSMGEYSWRGQQLDVSRDPFGPQPIFEPQIKALLECGYIMRSGASVRWTNKIGHAMIQAGFWDAELEAPSTAVISLPTLAQAHVERLLRSGQRIEAIAVIREAARIELTEAKWLMEQLEKAMVPK